MALVHEFALFKSEKEIVFNKESRKSMIRIDDYFIIYTMDTLMWIPSYWENLEQKKMGINYYGTTLFNEEGTKKLLQLIVSWQQVFNNSPEKFELSTEFIAEDGVFYKEMVEKQVLLSKLSNLENLCREALEREMLLVHFGV